MSFNTIAAVAIAIAMFCAVMFLVVFVPSTPDLRFVQPAPEYGGTFNLSDAPLDKPRYCGAKRAPLDHPPPCPEGRPMAVSTWRS